MKIRLSKRMLTALLIISLVVPVMAPMIYSQAADANIEKGDMNEDGEIDVKDLILVKQATEGDAADLNKDTSITDLDAKLMRYRLVDIISDFKGYYGLNGNTGNSQVMTTGVETAAIEEKTVAASYAIGDISDKHGNSAVLAGSQAISWTANHAVSFKVYNPTEYTHNIDIRAYKTANAVTNNTQAENTVILQGVHVKAKSSVTVTIYGSEFDYVTYPYLGIYTTTTYEQGDSIIEALKLYFYDFEEKSATVPNDYKWTKATRLRNMYTATNTDKQYVADGEYSLHFIPTGNSPVLAVNESVKWSEAGLLTISIYNPTTYTHAITLRRGVVGTETEVATIFGAATQLGEYTLQPGKNTITIADFTEWQDGEQLIFSTAHTSNGNDDSGEQWTAYKNQGIYIDISLGEKNYYALNGTAGTTEIMPTGVEALTLDDGKTVAASYATSKEGYNYPGAVFVGSNGITWGSDEALSFKVYNPTDYDYNFEVRAYKESEPETNANNINSSSVRLQGVTVKKNETVTVTIYSSMCDDWTTYPYLGIYTTHNNNGGVAAGATGGERMENMKLYFYDFAETTGTEPDTDDYKWTKTKTASMSQAFTAINTNKNYIADGEYSLFFVPTGNYASVVLTESGAQWSETGLLTIRIYNPTNYAHQVRFYRTTQDVLSQGATEATRVGEDKYTLNANDWTTITFADFSDWDANDKLTVRVNNNWHTAEGQWDAYKNQGIYIDISVTMK